MVEKRRYFKLVLISLIFLSILNINTYAASKKVYDQAGIFTQEQVSKLEKQAEKYSKRRKTNLLILTTKDSKWLGAEDFMAYMYDENKLGHESDGKSALIFTININTRDVYVSGFGKAKDLIDFNRSEAILDFIFDDLRDGDYYLASRRFLDKGYKYLGVKIGNNPDSLFLNLYFQLTLAFLIALISIASMLARTKGRVTVDGQTYKNHSTSGVIDRKDQYIRTSVTRQRVPRNDNSSGGSGGSSSSSGGGMTSGGSSYSGSGRKF